MNGIYWIFFGGVTGGLTGILLGEKGYGKVLSIGCAISFDTFFGVVGAFCMHTLFGAMFGEGSLFNNYGTALIGAIVLVGICRLVSETYFRSPSYRGMSRAAFIEWHDELTVKELASWKKRRAEQARSKSSAA
ncbi:MAG TPA: GlsB/YeaQ/YmgE family stress response membrane protein [Methylomirabilota bacterium]|jgi:uncharacterized membrane protein YeaQ/YmgE (transglycosylase-associated protein family)|nr:GlsB/YeaQ/YmgE family stress response membrane protein [Methylomirabilota bacterium]